MAAILCAGRFQVKQKVIDINGADEFESESSVADCASSGTSGSSYKTVQGSRLRFHIAELQWTRVNAEMRE